MICGSVFSNIGLLDYGLFLAGIQHAWGCEADDDRRAIWERRFEAPCYPDIRELRGDAVRPVELVAGGFPCKGASSAGLREGMGNAETVLWREMRRVIGELRPRYVLVENVANILALDGGSVWGEVLGDLATLGFDVVWDCLPAAAVGAPHRRDRVFAVATYPNRMAGAEGVPRGGGRGSLGEPAAVERAERLRRAHPSAPDAQRPDHRSEIQCREDGGEDAAGSPGGARRCGGEVAPNPGEGRREGGAAEHRTQRPEFPRHADGPGVQVGVEWGDYGPAIRRWEAIQGAAPAPLRDLRGVDDGGARRVERSRLSALGDGVQVQVGRIVGEYILKREAERMREAV